jgi:hypothetical protein
MIAKRQVGDSRTDCQSHGKVTVIAWLEHAMVCRNITMTPLHGMFIGHPERSDSSWHHWTTFTMSDTANPVSSTTGPI